METGTSTTRLDPDSAERFVALRRELGVTTFGLNQLILQPGQCGRIHRHEHQEEVIVVLEGTLTILIEGEPTDLGEGEMIRVAPDLRRQLTNRGPGRLVMLALGGATEHEGRDGVAYESWKSETGAPPQEIPAAPDLDARELRS